MVYFQEPLIIFLLTFDEWNHIWYYYIILWLPLHVNIYFFIYWLSVSSVTHLFFSLHFLLNFSILFYIVVELLIFIIIDFCCLLYMNPFFFFCTSSIDLNFGIMSGFHSSSSKFHSSADSHPLSLVFSVPVS